KKRLLRRGDHPPGSVKVLRFLSDGDRKEAARYKRSWSLMSIGKSSRQTLRARTDGPAPKGSTRYRIGCSWNISLINSGLVQRKGVNAMKTLISIFAVTLALAFTGPAFAGASAAKTEADCVKAGG